VQSTRARIDPFAMAGKPTLSSTNLPLCRMTTQHCARYYHDYKETTMHFNPTLTNPLRCTDAQACTTIESAAIDSGSFEDARPSVEPPNSPSATTSA